MKDKFKSRKFLLTVAALLGALGTAAAGMATDNEVLAVVSIVAGSVSTMIYNIVEGVIDKAAVGTKTSEE